MKCPRIPSSRVVAVLAASAVSLALVHGDVARADERPGPQPPSTLLPLVSGAVLLGGLALQLNVAFELRDRNPDCVQVEGGCFWLNVGAGTATLVGAAGLAFTAWRYGEVAAARDRPLRDVSSRKTVGLVLGGLALATTVGASIYSGVASAVDCVNDGEPDHACASRTAYVPTLVALAATPALIVGGALAAHAFGYEREAGRADMRSTLTPVILRGGGGLALIGRF